jgi:type I restriction-modification system DNA methylase subunit
MRKPKTGSVRVPSPYESTTWKVERSAAAVLMHWMRDIIEKKGLDLGPPDVDTSGADGKSPDIVIYESRRSQNVLCIIEAKRPYFDVFDEKELKEPARQKATARRAKYFCTTNFKDLIWFNTEKVNSLKPDVEQIVNKYHLSELEDLNLIEDTRYKESIIRQLEIFLTQLYAVHTGKEAEPKLAIDELLIYRIHDKIRRLARYYTTIIEDKCHKDTDFCSQLGKWFVEQGWNFAWQPQDFDKTARQTAYLLVNKILFYEALRAKRPQKLAPLQIPEGLTKGAQLQKALKLFFDDVLDIDYETIYTADFIDDTAFTEGIPAAEIVKEIRELVDILRQYDFAKLGYDIIGRIFERLIPQDERHNLGQYFTNPDVVDIIIEFCLQDKKDGKVFDPACGAGTFLVRAYQHKKLMNQYQKHEDILDRLWGNDIAKFPAHLSTINLAINDLAADRNYPNILQEDFFKLLSTEGGFEIPRKWRKARATTLRLEERELEYPRWFDCIVGNPPYTRQEEISEIAPKDKAYKDKIIDKALFDNKGKQLAEISKRAGIYVYFFVHGTKFLQNGGRFGFVVNNSWLDVDYGKGLQKFFLENYKIIAIIESKVERWFEDADINTCIVILEKCSSDDRRRERNENVVRFVYLKKPLRYFIPAAQDIWERQIQRHNAIQDKFIKTILAHNELYDDEDLRIFPKKQSELWAEGYDAKKRKYVGSKWGKYLRAPDIFFKILEKGKDKLVPLKQVAEVKFGIKTGADPWFYVSDITDSINSKDIQRMMNNAKPANGIRKLRCIKSGDGTRWLTEGQYLARVICNPANYKAIAIDTRSVEDFVVRICEPRDKVKGKLIENYVSYGERKPYKMGKGRNIIPARTETCLSRKYWYELPDIEPARVFWQKAFDICLRHFLADEHILANQRFYPVYPKDSEDTEVIAAFLNSPIVHLYLEFQRTIMGMGAIEATVDEVKQILIANPKTIETGEKTKLVDALNDLKNRELGSVFQELGASSPKEVSLDKVKPDRRELDKIIMGEILGLTDEEQLEVYRAVIDLVKSRIEKAKSFGKRKRTKEGIDVDLLVKTVMEKVGEDTLGKFHREKVLSQKQLYTKALPKAGDEIAVRQSLLGWRLYSGKEYIDCASELEARYLRVWLQAGMVEVKVPKDEGYLETIVPELESLKAKIDDAIEAHLSFIANPRTRDRIVHRLWQEITK